MSPLHISVDEARKRIELARKQLDDSIKSKSVDPDEITYLQGVLQRGEKNCNKSEKEFLSKQ